MEKHTLFILFNYRWKHRQSFQKDSLCTYYLLNLIALDSSLLGINCTVLKQGKINCKKNNFGLEEKQNILLYFGIIILCLFIYDRFSFRGKKKTVSPGMASNTIVNCIAIGAEKNKQTNKHFFFCYGEHFTICFLFQKAVFLLYYIPSIWRLIYLYSSVHIVVLPSQVFRKRVTSDNYTINCIKKKKKVSSCI